MKLNKPTIITIAVAGAVVVVLGILLIRSQSQMAEMTQVFTEEREQLVTDYQDLYAEYDDLHSDNDSLDQLVVEQRARVEQLTEELRTLRASNARRIKELQGELTTLRTVMRSFVVQIDSLNASNNALRQENSQIRGQLESVSRARADLQAQNETLNQQMTVASRLEAKDVKVTYLNDKDRETTRMARIAKIKVSFTLAKNVSAQVGMRDVYLRLTRPDGEVLMHSMNDKFTYEDRELNFSAKRQIEYGGEDTQGSIIYTVDMGELTSGKYDAELFCGGELIGRAEFSMKD